MSREELAAIPGIVRQRDADDAIKSLSRRLASIESKGISNGLKHIVEGNN
jgi:hypothetical protein